MSADTPPVLGDLTNITYRMLDYWIRTGVIGIRGDSTGPGVPRVYTTNDINRIQLLDRLHPVLAVRHAPRPGIPTEWVSAIWDALADGRWPRLLYLHHTTGTWEHRLPWPTSVPAWLTIDTAVTT